VPQEQQGRNEEADEEEEGDGKRTLDVAQIEADELGQEEGGGGGAEATEGETFPFKEFCCC